MAFICIFAAVIVYRHHIMKIKIRFLNGYANSGKRSLKRLANVIGLPCVYSGVILMAAIYIFNLTNYNSLLLLGVLLILAGIIGYVYKTKAESQY